MLTSSLRFRRALVASALFALLGAGLARAETFALMIYETQSALAARTEAKEAATYWAAFADYGRRLTEAGVLRGGAAMHTGEKVRTVRVRAERSSREPGPATRSGEELGGYFVIEVPTLAEALQWAERAPNAATGAVEVRPYFPSPAMR